MKTSVAVLSLALNHGVHEKSALYRLKRGTKVHLVPGASLLGRKVALYCNYPNNSKLILMNYLKKRICLIKMCIYLLKKMMILKEKNIQH